MTEMSRIVQKPAEFIDSATENWSIKSEVIFKHATDVESLSNSKLCAFLRSLNESGKNINSIYICSIVFVRCKYCCSYDFAIHATRTSM